MGQRYSGSSSHHNDLLSLELDVAISAIWLSTALNSIISWTMKIDNEANIIVCSAISQQNVVAQAIEAGGKDFIVKLFDESRILDSISRVLENSSMAKSSN